MRGRLAIDPDTKRRFFESRVGPVGLVLVLLVVATSIVGPWFTVNPDSEFRAVLIDELGMPRAPLEVPGHPLGGDSIGRDELARLLVGGRVSLGVALGATLLAVLVGVTLGVSAGYAGGRFDDATLFLIDVMLSMPFLLVAMSVRKVLPNDLGTSGLIVLLGILSWPGIARVVRARAMTLRELDFVTAARAMGASPAYIVARHLIPNLSGPIIAVSTSLVSGMVLSESSLSFLGFGVAPPTASWGSMLQESQDHLFDVPRLFAFSAAMLVATILGFNLLGQGLRDALDPKG